MKNKTRVQDSNDMTSMIDVTFLLLIFFVVTASFFTTQAINTEPASLPSLTPVNVESTPLRILVDEHNQIFVGEDGWEVYVSTPRELRDTIRSSVDSDNVDSIMIDAHEKSRHKSVVQVCDAGRAVGVSRIKVNPYK